MYFWTYGLRKTWLEKCLKSPISEDPFKSNMINEPKRSSKLNDSNFTIFIYPCDGNSSLKNFVSEDPSTSNTVNGWKDWRNLKGSTFTKFTDLSEDNYVWKSLSELYTKSYNVC